MPLKLYRKYALISTLFTVIALCVSGSMPKTYKITGVVLNKETNEPIPLVEVFISGSTYGSITSEEGKFELETSYLPCQLVASHISYAPFNKLIDAESLTPLTIKLIPYQHEIKEITVESMSRRKDNMELFRRGFLGWDDIANTCTILNDSVLSFTWDPLVAYVSRE